MNKIRQTVKKKYAEAIQSRTGCGANSSSCCGGTGGTSQITSNLYTHLEVSELPEDILASSFGCGNPTALTELHEGETVLDLGSGAGLDVLLSAKRVGPTGKAYGLDMTDEMLEVAEKNRELSGLTNAEFLKGHIEEIPLPNSTVDVIISNCVINLSGDKDKVLKEAFRVLKPEGRFAVSDIVILRELPEKIRKSLLAWAGCISGAMTISEYQNKLLKAGFEKVDVEITQTYEFSEIASDIYSGLTTDEQANLENSIASAFIRASKPSSK